MVKLGISLLKLVLYKRIKNFLKILHLYNMCSNNCSSYGCTWSDDEESGSVNCNLNIFLILNSLLIMSQSRHHSSVHSNRNNCPTSPGYQIWMSVCCICRDISLVAGLLYHKLCRSSFINSVERFFVHTLYIAYEMFLVLWRGVRIRVASNIEGIRCAYIVVCVPYCSGAAMVIELSTGIFC